MDKKTIVIGVLVAVIAHDTVVAAKNRRKFNHNLQVAKNSQATSHYLASLLDKNGIHLDEFDETALLTINDK